MAILNGFLNSKREFCCCFVVVILGPLNRTSHFHHIDIAKKNMFSSTICLFFMTYTSHILAGMSIAQSLIIVYFDFIRKLCEITHVKVVVNYSQTNCCGEGKQTLCLKKRLTKKSKAK